MNLTSTDWTTTEPRVLATTESVCPVCLERIPARRTRRGEDIYLEKCCPRHGEFKALIWRGGDPPRRERQPAHPQAPARAVERGCPFDCGLCPAHEQQPCCVLLEVTGRCNLRCPVCYASAGEAAGPDPDLDQIRGWYERLAAAGGPFNIQLSGGEPSLRDDLPEIIRLGKTFGFEFFQLNTNGLRIADDLDYLARLKEAGLSAVYLQFDGLDDDVYLRLRGRAVLEQKLRAIENCAALRLGVVLTPTLAAGVNTHQVGALLRFGAEHSPVVRGVHFQPMSYFGRFPQEPDEQGRVTLPDVTRWMEEQTGGWVRAAQFKPSGGSHAQCGFQGNFVVMPDGSLAPATRPDSDAGCCGLEDARESRLKAQRFVARQWAAPVDAPVIDLGGPAFGGWDDFLARRKTHLFAISGMAFQDAWTLDLERLRQCYIMVVAPDGQLIPFCAYNLTDRDGRGLYR